jgi:predicted dehydrogenase
MKIVRMGIVGMGVMGTAHAKSILAGAVKGMELTAVCDTHTPNLAQVEGPRKFDSVSALIRSGLIDAVVIATPHYGHTVVGIEALKAGLHVLVEKPISVHKADAERLLAAHRNRRQVFAAMFNLRATTRYRRVRQFIEDGTLGSLVRVTWMATHWFRTNHYYASGGWRGTWKGEGGGVLLNQCPHQLDLLQWFCGMPTRLMAFCKMGAHHPIEVEDEVTAYLEYPNGATGTFVATTGEWPGTDRLVLACDKAQIEVTGDGRTILRRNRMATSELCRTSRETMPKPEPEVTVYPDEKEGAEHVIILANFAEAILEGAPLIASAREGLNSLELSNAMIYSSLTGKPVTFPLNGAAYARRLNQLIRGSGRGSPKSPGKRVRPARAK